MNVIRHGQNQLHEQTQSQTQRDEINEFQKQQETKQHDLYKEAISIMESLVGYYHPDVADTYHLFGWSLYELGGRKTASALVYFLRALRISQRLFGNDHSSTIVLLDDIRDLVDEQRDEYGTTNTNNHNNNNNQSNNNDNNNPCYLLENH